MKHAHLSARRGRGGLLLVVIIGHGLLALLLAQSPSPARHTTGPAPVVPMLWLRLLHEAPPARIAQTPQAPQAGRSTRPMSAPHPRAPEKVAATPAPRLAPPLAPRLAAGSAEPQAIRAAAVPVDPAIAASAASAASAAPPHTAAAPLELRLPPSATQPAPAAALTRDDPRVREPLSYGERMARTMGTDTTLHEDTMPDGSRRFRRGHACVMARPSRDSELDAFNNSARPKPRSVGRC